MTGDPGLSSSRSDAGLVTCQVHRNPTPRRPRHVEPQRHSNARLALADHPDHSSLLPTS